MKLVTYETEIGRQNVALLVKAVAKEIAQELKGDINEMLKRLNAEQKYPPTIKGDVEAIMLSQVIPLVAFLSAILTATESFSLDTEPLTNLFKTESFSICLEPPISSDSSAFCSFFCHKLSPTIRDKSTVRLIIK